MEIVSLEGHFEESLDIQNEVKKITLTHKSSNAFIPLAPADLLAKWKVPRSGFYSPIDVRLVVTPHVSEKSGVLAIVKLVDARDPSPARVLYQSKQFNLGHGLIVEGSQLPFCLRVGEYPLQFEVAVSRSQFREGSKIFTTSVEWRMLHSPAPLSRVRSVMGSAQAPVLTAPHNFKMRLEAPGGGGKGKKLRRGTSVNGQSGRWHHPTSVGGSSDVTPEYAQCSVGDGDHFGDTDSIFSI